MITETATWLPFDDGQVESIAADLDLRSPNRNGLAAVVEAIQFGDGREVVCDLATGVGKTYLAAGLIEYLARQGVRNVLFVTPGTTIFDKTVANFTPGSRKFIEGASFEPTLVTADNFRRGQLASDLNDDTVLKLFVFNVQQLLRPTAKTSRKTRQEDEFIGGSLYEHLRESDDLVIIADEHHMYQEKAKAFSAAIRELSPRALIGLTATPDKSDRDKVVYRFTLAQAIAKELVKVPVIVYRGDTERDSESQLADACRLRAAKEPHWQEYAETFGKPAVKPVLFVVCQEIGEAERWAERLRQDGMIGSGDGVLLVTSNSNDADLAALAAVEDPDSPVRAIVSVNKLGVGWDVKNVAVIVALRKLASESLTEQILGRGLRLPFGKRTSVGAIDRVEIVAHESYRQLLRNKNALLEAEVVDEQGDRRGVVGGRLQIRSPQGDTETLFSALAKNPAQDGQVTYPASGDVENADQEFTLLADDHEQILKDLSEAAARPATMTRCEGAPEIIFPRQEFALTQARQFSVEMINPGHVEKEGRMFADDPAAYLERVELNVVEDAAGNVVDVIGQAIDRVEATKRRMPFHQLREQLVDAVSSFGLVENTLAEFTVIEEIVDKFLAGAGVEEGSVPEDWSEQRSVQAIAALRALVHRQFKATRPASTRTYTWSFHKVPVVRPMPEVAQDRWERFVQGEWYGPWDNAITPYARFDSDSGEFTFTLLANTSRGGLGVAWWLRLDKQYDREAHLRYGAGRYFPDFVVIDDDGVRWLVEVKDDNRAYTDSEVIAKRRLGFEWAGATADHKAEIGATWRYLFVTESEIKASNNSWHALVRRGAHWEQEHNQA